MMLVIEIVAVITGLTCVFLQTQENQWAWPFGILSVALYVYIFGESYLFSDLLLNSIFVVLNFYGWWNWSEYSPREEIVEISQLKKDKIQIWIIISILGTLVGGYLMDTQTRAAYPYPDAFVVVASLVAQIFLARKVIENWLIWVIVDIVAIVLYIMKGLNLTAMLFVAYLALSIMGHFKWQKKFSKSII